MSQCDFIIIDDFTDIKPVHSGEHKKFIKRWLNKKAKIQCSKHTEVICKQIDKILIKKHLNEPIRFMVKVIKHEKKEN